MDPADAADEALLRRSVALVWLLTGVSVLHPTFRAIGAEHLGRLGAPGWLMQATCAGEVALAAALWVRRTDRAQAALQTAPVVFFTATLLWLEPALGAHPFGVLTKNLPLLAAVWAAERLGRGDARAAIRLLRGGVALIWLTEGLFPKLVWQSPLELGVVAAVGLPAALAPWIVRAIGLLELAAAAGTAALDGPPLRALLRLELAALVVLPLVVAAVLPEMLVHPFGPLIKNFPILAATWILERRCSTSR